MRPLFTARRLLLQGLILPLTSLLFLVGGRVALWDFVPAVHWVVASAKESGEATCTSVREATALQEEGRFTEARSLLKSCLTTDCTNRQRAECAGALQRIKEQSPSLVVLAGDGSGHDVADLSVTMDGVLVEDRLDGNAVFVDAGEHEFQFQRSGYKPVIRRLTLRRGEKFHVVAITLEPVAADVVEEPPLVEPRVAHWVGVSTLGAVGLAGATTFALVGAHARSEEKALEDCQQVGGCPQGRIASVRARYVVANAALGAGVLSLGVALWVLLSNDTSPEDVSDGGTAEGSGRQASGWTVQPVVGAQSIHLVGTF